MGRMRVAIYERLTVDLGGLTAFSDGRGIDVSVAHGKPPDAITLDGQRGCSGFRR